MMTGRTLAALLIIASTAQLSGAAGAQLAASRSQSAAPMPAQWAIVVGDARPDVWPLIEAAQRATAAALKAQFGYTPERVIELYGPAATQADIRRTLATTSSSIRPGDSLLVYMLLPSIERKGTRYFVPVDGREADVWTLLGQDELDELIGRSRLRAALIVSRNCSERVSPREQFVQQSSLRAFASLGLATLSFCDRGAPDSGTRRFADAFAEMLRSADAQRITDAELALRLRESLPGMSIDVQRESPYVEEGFAFVVVRRRTDALLEQVRNARNTDEQIRSIDSLVTLARTGTDGDIRAVVIKTIGGAARNDAWSTPARVRALAALGEIGSADAVPELAGVVATTTAPPGLRRSAVDALARIGTAETLAPVLQALGDASALVRVSAVRAVGGHRYLKNATTLLARVADVDADVRVASLQMIGILSKPAAGAPNLITPIAPSARKAVEAVLNDTIAAVRRESVNTLAKLGVDLARHTEVITLLKSDPDESVRATVALTLGREYRGLPGERLRAPAFAELMAAATSGPVSVRPAAMWSLGEIGDRRAGGVLKSALRDPEMKIREAAVEALGRMRDSEPVPNIITLLSDDEPRIRIAAARALGAIGDSRASEHLIARLSSEKEIYARQALEQALAQLPPPSLQLIADALHDKAPKVRRGAVERLADIDDPAAAKYGIAALGDQDPEIRQTALTIVVKHMPAWFTELKMALESPETVTRFNVAAALGQIGTEDAGSALLSRFEREQTPFVRVQIASALAFVKPSMPIEDALVAAALEPDPMLRAAAATSLSKYSSPRVQDMLRALAEDEDSIVREEAIRSLRKVFK